MESTLEGFRGFTRCLSEAKEKGVIYGTGAWGKGEIEGSQALFVVNLEPRKMMGEISEGMLFDIGYADGITPVLAVPEKKVPDGTRVG